VFIAMGMQEVVFTINVTNGLKFRSWTRSSVFTDKNEVILQLALNVSNIVIID
jgi:hypothetical protein